MYKILMVIVLAVAVLAGGYMFIINKPTTLRDADFTNATQYTCADGKTLGTAFAQGVVRVSLYDKRVFVLEQISVDDESGTKFANEDDQVVLWVRDDSAFLEENGATTYAACRTSR